MKKAPSNAVMELLRHFDILPLCYACSCHRLLARELHKNLLRVDMYQKVSSAWPVNIIVWLVFLEFLPANSRCIVYLASKKLFSTWCLGFLSLNFVNVWECLLYWITILLKFANYAFPKVFSTARYLSDLVVLNGLLCVLSPCFKVLRFLCMVWPCECV